MACEIVDRLKVRSCLIDGEAVACDENGLAVFERLRRKPRVSMSSSTPSTSSRWMAKTCGASRWRRARRRSRACCAGAFEHLAHDGESVFRHACAMGLEGIVSKRIGSCYRSGRSKNWLKSKNLEPSAVKREAEEDWIRWSMTSEIWK
jgi:bifunctional non-homologous end joining protein LigD